MPGRGRLGSWLTSRDSFFFVMWKKKARGDEKAKALEGVFPYSINLKWTMTKHLWGGKRGKRLIRVELQ